MDTSHIAVNEITHWRNNFRKLEFGIGADIHGIKTQFNAVSLDDRHAFTQEYEVTNANWRFEQNGVRLNIVYIERSTGKERKLSARMDFHMREVLERMQGALDLEGEFLNLLVGEMGDHNDHHFADNLDGVLNAELMDQIRTSRFEQVEYVYKADLYRRKKGRRSTPIN